MSGTSFKSEVSPKVLGNNLSLKGSGVSTHNTKEELFFGQKNGHEEDSEKVVVGLKTRHFLDSSERSIRGCFNFEK